jgi:hypothetical protein
MRFLDDVGMLSRLLPVICDIVAATKLVPNPIENTKMNNLKIHLHAKSERVLRALEEI